MKKSYRIAIGGLEDEVNTFIKQKGTLADFDINEGAAILQVYEGSRTYLGGMIFSARELGVSLCPALHAQVSVACTGTIQAETYHALKTRLLDQLRALLPLDGICLALHGAGVAEGVEDVETDLLQAVRKLAGEETIIAVTLDLHGNVSPELLQFVDLVYCLNNAPHTDMFDRGAEAMTGIVRVLAGEWKPYIHLEKLPLLLTPITTNSGMGQKLRQLCLDAEQLPGVLDCACFHGFPYADVNCLGTSVIVMTDDRPDLSRKIGQEIAAWIWDHREQMLPRIVKPKEGLEIARNWHGMYGEPVVILDSSDNPGGGGPGNGTHLLKAMLESGMDHAVFALLKDAAAVQACQQAGVGARLDLALGGNDDELNGSPIPCTVLVKDIRPGKFRIVSDQRKGELVDLGTCILVSIGGIDLILAEKSFQPFDPEIFRLFGLDHLSYDYIAMKSTNHWRSGFPEIRHSIITDAPGYMSMNLENFPYQVFQKNMWPLDRTVVYK